MGTSRDVSLIMAAALSEGQPIEVLRTGTFTDMYGRDVEITEELLDTLAVNFEEGAAGQDIPVDINHEKDEAAGWLTALWREGERLLARVDWNKKGQQLVSDRVYRYVSAFLRPTEGLLKSVSLVNFPAVKNLAPVELGEGGIWRSLTGMVGGDVGLAAWPAGQVSVAAWLQAMIHSNFTMIADAMAKSGMVDAEERKVLSSAIGAGLEAFAQEIGDVGERLIAAPSFDYYYCAETAGETPALPTDEEDVTMGEVDEKALREQVEAELRQKAKDEAALREKIEAELRESIRAEEQERAKRHADYVAFAEEVCNGEVGLPQSPEDVVAFLEGLPVDRVDDAKAMLRGKVVQFGEAGSSAKGAHEDERAQLAGPVAAALKAWVAGGNDVAEFFELNAGELGDAGQYDLAEFEEQG